MIVRWFYTGESGVHTASRISLDSAVRLVERLLSEATPPAVILTDGRALVA